MSMRRDLHELRAAYLEDLLLVPSSWSDEAEQPSPRRAAEDDTNSTAALVGTLRELAASASSRPRAELTWRRTHTFPEVKAAVPAGQLRRNLSEQQLRRCSEPPIGATEEREIMYRMSLREYIMGDEEFQGAAFESYLEKADVTEGASLARSARRSLPGSPAATGLCPSFASFTAARAGGGAGGGATRASGSGDIVGRYGRKDWVPALAHSGL
eukprot:g26276.t1